MNSSKITPSKLADAIVTATSPQSSTTTDASVSPPCNDLLSALEEAKKQFLVVGLMRLLLRLDAQTRAEPNTDYIVVEGMDGGVHRLWCGHHTPPCPPDHPDPTENDRQLCLWFRERKWVGSTSAELMVKRLNNDLTDCTYDDGHGDSIPWTPPEPAHPKMICPIGIDRIGESHRKHFDAEVKAFDIDISMFFRADDDLGFGNRPEYALYELDCLFNRLRAAAAASKLPPIPQFTELMEKSDLGSGGSTGSGSPPPPQKSIGGR